jgi:hypothetical protein
MGKLLNGDTLGDEFPQQVIMALIYRPFHDEYV